MRKLRIVSDGQPKNTRVFDAETGEEIANVIDVTISIDARNGAVATITIFRPELDIIATEKPKEP
jgi:hypothetical protein